MDEISKTTKIELISRQSDLLDQREKEIEELECKLEKAEITINHKNLEFGEIDYLKQIIKIKKVCHGEFLESTLFHEIIHGILEQLGFVEENKNEHLVCSLETGLYQVLKENFTFSF